LKNLKIFVFQLGRKGQFYFILNQFSDLVSLVIIPKRFSINYQHIGKKKTVQIVENWWKNLKKLKRCVKMQQSYLTPNFILEIREFVTKFCRNFPFKKKEKKPRSIAYEWLCWVLIMCHDINQLLIM